MDGGKVVLGSRGMTVGASQQCAKSREEQRALVDIFRFANFNTTLFTGSFVHLGLPSDGLSFVWVLRLYLLL